MDEATVEDWIARVAAERERTAPPPGFPVLPDVPGARYTDPAFFALERDRLWRRTWLYAAHVDQVPNAGDFVVWRHGSAPIVIIRGDDDVIRAFYNTCRHRGAPVFREDAGTATARVACGYHGWTYDRHGRLVGVTEPRDWRESDTACRNLVDVRIERYGNWLFVNEDPAAPPLAEFLAPFARCVDHLPLDTLRLVHRDERVVRSNVKVLIENFLEAYHFNLLHVGTTHRIFDNRGTNVHLWANGHSMMLSPFRRDGWVDPGTVGMPEMPGCTDVERHHNPSYSVFPNLILPIAPSGIPGVAMWPRAVDTAVIEVLWFAPGVPGAARDPLWNARIANFDRIVAEDIRFAEPIQDSLDSPGFTGVPLSYQERRIYHWHEEADRRIGAAHIPEPLRVQPVLDPFLER